MDDLITICIPTCRRPDLLKDALESRFRQSYRPLQILIGDDSGDDRSVKMIRGSNLPEGIVLTHVVHDPSLRQARNVDWLHSQLND